jgi:hypothetical protein
MRPLLHAAALAALFCAALRCQDPDATDINVNARYTVESVEVAPQAKFAKLSRQLQQDLKNLVGKNLDNDRLKELAKRICDELQVAKAEPKVSKGEQAETVKVVFQPEGHSISVSANNPKFMYHSQLGFNTQVEISTRRGRNTFSAGYANDGDELVERFEGFRAKYRRAALGSERIELGFEWDAYHQQWSPQTVNELAAETQIPGIYRWRQNFQPVLTVTLGRGFSADVGASVQLLQIQYPAAVTEASNSVVTSLRYQRGWAASQVYKHDVTAGYSLHAATRTLNSDFVYSRNAFDAAYTLKTPRTWLMVRFDGGVLGGAAPMYERFTAGNCRTLRGWNKNEIGPVGGNRMAAGTVEYHYRFVWVFYDTGAVWNSPESAEARNSAGIGLWKGGLQLAVAFPMKSGHMDVVFMAGMNF